MNIPEYIDLIEQQNKEQDNIYHKVASAFGMSDTALWMLYIVSNTEGRVTQQDLCRMCFYPKQTVNSTINSLIKNGYVRLDAIPETKKSKRIVLTEAGEVLAQKTAYKLREAEIRAYGKLSCEELRQYLETSTKLTALLREETEALSESDGG